MLKAMKTYNISHKNLSTYGFTVFYDSKLPQIQGRHLEREVVTDVGIAPEVKTCKFRIPKELLIDLSGIVKISSSELYKISTNSDSREIISLLLSRAGWNQTRADINSIYNLATGSIFISSFEHFGKDIALGSGVCLPVNNDMCWIGMILVHQELRRHGIARSIMNTCLNHAWQKMNSAIIGLDATPMGKQVYDSLGFKDSFVIWRSVISTEDSKKNLSNGIEISDDTKMIGRYLQKIDYLERENVIKILSKLPGANCAVAKYQGKLLGFILSRPGRLMPFIGTLLADSSEVAAVLLSHILEIWNAKGYSQVFMDIPAHHLSSTIFVNKENYNRNSSGQFPVEPKRALTRMYQLIEPLKKVKGDKLAATEASTQGLGQTIEGFNKSRSFMDKESKTILPLMFGTSGPEWS